MKRSELILGSADSLATRLVVGVVGDGGKKHLLLEGIEYAVSKMIPSLGREGIYPLVRYCPLCFQKELSDMTKMGQPRETAPWVGAGGFCGILFYHRNRIKIGAPLERVSTPKPSTLAARGGFEGRTSRCF